MDSQEATLPAAGGGPATLNPALPHSCHSHLSPTQGASGCRTSTVTHPVPRADDRSDGFGETASEQRFFGRNPVASREVVRAGLSLHQDPVLEALVKDFGRLQPKLAQRILRPAIGLVVVRTRGFRYEQPSSGFEEGSRALGHHGRTAEGAGQHAVEAGPESRYAAQDLGPLLLNRDPVRHSQSLDRPPEEGGAPAVGLEEVEGGVGPLDGYHQTGQPAARAEIHEPGRTTGRQPQSDGHETLRVADLWLQWTGSEEPEGARLQQELVQEGGGVVPLVGAGHRRLVSSRAR